MKRAVVTLKKLPKEIVKDIQTQYGSGKFGRLSDGTTAVARLGSKTVGATLMVKVFNSKIHKIGY